MALSNSQIMTHESLLKVLDYIDERDSMQAVPWNGAIADIKKVVNRSEEIGMRVNGMSATLNGITYNLSGMTVYIGEEGTENYPIFGGYVTGTYTDATGTEITEPLYVVVKYGASATSYVTSSVKKLAGEESDFVVFDSTSVYADAKEALEDGKKVAFSAVNFVRRPYDPVIGNGFAISGMLDFLEHDINTEIPAKSNVVFSGIVAGVDIQLNDEGQNVYSPDGKYYRAKAIIKEDAVEIDLNEDMDYIPFDAVQTLTYGADKDDESGNWTISIPEWSGEGSPTIENLYYDIEVNDTSGRKVIKLNSNGEEFIYSGTTRKSVGAQDINSKTFINGEKELTVKWIHLNEDPWTTTYSIEVKDIGGSVEKHVIKTEVDADGKITLIEPNNMTEVWNMVKEYGSDLVAEVSGTEFFGVPSPITVICDYVSSWDTILGQPKNGVYFFAPNPLNNDYYGYYLFANELQGEPDLILKGYTTSITINKNEPVDKVNDRCDNLGTGMLNLVGMGAELDGATVYLEGAIPANGTDPNGNWQFYGFAKTDTGVPCEVEVKYDTDAGDDGEYVATVSRLGSVETVVYELPLVCVQGGDHGTPMTFNGTSNVTWNEDEETVSTLNHILDDVYAGKNVNVILDVTRSGGSSTLGDYAFTHAILVDNEYDGDHVALIGGNTSISLDEEGTVFEPYGYILIKRYPATGTVATYVRSTLNPPAGVKIIDVVVDGNGNVTYMSPTSADGIMEAINASAPNIVAKVTTTNGFTATPKVYYAWLDSYGNVANKRYAYFTWETGYLNEQQSFVLYMDETTAFQMTDFKAKRQIRDIFAFDLEVSRTGTSPDYSYEVYSDEGLDAVIKGIFDNVYKRDHRCMIQVNNAYTVPQALSANQIRLYTQIGTKIGFPVGGEYEYEDFGLLDLWMNSSGAVGATYTPVSISGGGGGGVDMATVKAYVDPKFENKVDKVTGKDLSANDFTDILKTKLDGIEEEAQKNVQSDWNATSGDSFIKNKPDVYTQDEIDDFLDDIYTKTEVDTKLGDYYKKTETYTKTEVDTKLGDYYKKTETYNKTEVDTKLGDYYKKTETYNKTEVDAELAKKVDKTLDDYLTKAELITDGIKITPNNGSAIEYKLDKYVEKAEMTSENLVKITQHDGTTVEQKPYLAKVETIQVDGLDEYKITDNKGVETKLDVYKRADTFGRDEDAVPTDLVTYGKKQIDDMIKALEGVTMKVVATVPAPADATAGTIYICDGTMYLCYKNGTGESAPKVITPIGGTAPDLTQYWKKTDGDLMSTAEHTKLTQDYTKAEVDAKFVQLEDPDYKNPDDYLEKVELVNNRLKITPHGGTAVTQQPFIMEVIKNEDVYDFKESNNNVVTIDITTAVTSELEAWIDTVLV